MCGWVSLGYCGEEIKIRKSVIEIKKALRKLSILEVKNYVFLKIFAVVQCEQQILKKSFAKKAFKNILLNFF